MTDQRPTKTTFASNLDEVRARREFLESLQIEHGPHALLGRFFLVADRILKDLGIRLVQSSLAELVDLQTSNVTSWPLFAPMLDTRLGGVDPEMSYGFIGLDRKGAIACAQGGRIYSSGDRSLFDLMDDHSFFYGDNCKPGSRQPYCSATAPSARTIRGVFTYSGALWVHPEHRGQRLAALLPRLSRAFALTRWNSAYTIAVVSEQIAASSLLAMYGYKTVEPGFRMSNIGPKDYVGYLMSMTSDDLLNDLSLFLSGKFAEIDPAVSNSGNQHKFLPPAKFNR